MKRTVSIIFVFALLLFSSAAVFMSGASVYTLGDVDGSGDVTPADARLILRYCVGLEDAFDDIAMELADVDRSGAVDPADARLALRTSVYLEDAVTVSFDDESEEPGTAAEPVPDTTEEPVPDTTEAPAPDTTETPVPDTTEAPVPDTTEAPAPDTTETPVPDTTETPVPDTTEPPVPDTTEAPVPDITEGPELDTTEAPVPDTTEAPVPDTTEEPIPDTTEAPVPDTTEAPVPDTTEEPVPDTTEPPEPDTTEPSVPDTTEEPEPDTSPALPEVRIRNAEWTDVEWEDWSGPYFTLRIPKGWKVEWNGGATQLAWRAVSPDGSVGVYNIDHYYAAKSAPMAPYLGMDYTLYYGTVQEYFETIYAPTTERFTVMNSCVPSNKDLLQSYRPDTAIRDYQTLYATYTEDGKEGEGIYSAVVMESPDVYDHYGNNYGLWEINCTFTQWAPLGQLVDWQSVMSAIFASFQYTDYYIAEWRSVLGSSSSPDSSTINDNDPILEAFEERDRSDTIIQEKRSDMIGEYERVYDNENGNIYRAYNGFLDDIGTEQTRYVSITDDQYADGFVGWIDKD